MMRNLDLQSGGVGEVDRADGPVVRPRPELCDAVFDRVNGLLAEDFLAELYRYYEQAGWADVMGDFIFPDELASAVIQSDALFAEWEDRKGKLTPGLPLFKLVSSLLYSKLLERLEGIDVDVDYMDALRCIILIGESSMAMGQPIAPVVSRTFARIGRIIDGSEDQVASALYQRAVAKLPASITSDSFMDSADRVVQKIGPLLENLSPQQILKVQRAAERNCWHAIALVLAQSFLMKVSGTNIKLPLEFDDEAAEEVLSKLSPLYDALRKEQPNLYPEYATEVDDAVAPLLGAIAEIIEDEKSLKRAIAVAREAVAARVIGATVEEESFELPEAPDTPVSDPEPVLVEPAVVESAHAVAEPAPAVVERPFQELVRRVVPKTRFEPLPTVQAPAEFPKNFRRMTRDLVRVCPEQQLQKYYFDADEAHEHVWMIRFLEELLRHDPTPGRRLLYAQALSDAGRDNEAHVVATALAYTLGNSREFAATADDNRRFLAGLADRIEAKNGRLPSTPAEAGIQLPALDERLSSVELPEGFDEMDYSSLRDLSVNARRTGNRGLNVAIQKRMIELAPDSPSTRYFYGLALEDFGFDELALEQLQLSGELKRRRGDVSVDERKDDNLRNAIERISARLGTVSDDREATGSVGAVETDLDLSRFQHDAFFVFVKNIAVIMQDWEVESQSGLNIVRRMPMDTARLIEEALEYYEYDELKKYSQEAFPRFIEAIEAFKSEAITGSVNERSVLKVLQNRFWKGAGKPVR